jgi:membrane AbrB-like protein
VHRKGPLALAVVVLAAAGVAAGLDRIGTPGGWLIGPLLVAIVAAVSGFVDARIPRWLFIAAQGAIGALIAQTFTPPVVASIVRYWAVMALVVGTTIVAATFVGWLLARFGSLPASTAAWGSSPGGASAMTAMSADYGADPRLVAFMQYLRVTLVVLTAGAVSRVLLPAGAIVGLPGAHAFAPLAVAETVVISLAGTLIALRLRIPGGPLLGPMILGALAGGSGIAQISVPASALAAAYLIIGLYVGLAYTRATVAYALRALPQLIVSSLILIGLCGLSAVLLAATMHVDALTAYLATTPGALESVTAIALGSQANVPLVLAVQALRVIVVLLSGPPLAKLIARTA